MLNWKRLGAIASVLGFLIGYGLLVWGAAKEHSKWEARGAVTTWSNESREGVEMRPAPSQHPSGDDPDTTDSTEERTPFSWMPLLVIGMFLGLPALAVFAGLAERLIDALETKWSQRPPDPPILS